MFRQYAESAKQANSRSGSCGSTDDHKWKCLNFPTKKHWRIHRNRVNRGRSAEVAETYSPAGIASVSFPQLGCGNGGLDWSRCVLS